MYHLLLQQLVPHFSNKIAMQCTFVSSGHIKKKKGIIIQNLKGGKSVLFVVGVRQLWCKQQFSRW